MSDYTLPQNTTILSSVLTDIIHPPHRSIHPTTARIFTKKFSMAALPALVLEQVEDAQQQVLDAQLVASDALQHALDAQQDASHALQQLQEAQQQRDEAQ